MPRSRIGTAVRITAAILSAATLAIAAGCVRTSNGTWYFKSAATPEGWPALTPIGEVEVKAYPEYRAATVTERDLSGEGMRPLFRELFRHISENDIPMTAPVDMGYAGDGQGGARMTSMAFMYEGPEQGALGADGAVSVEQLAARTWASVGMRGSYSDRNFLRGLEILDAWLADHPEWRASGDPRFLGYNGPFVPVFWRYGEVQVPVEPGKD